MNEFQARSALKLPQRKEITMKDIFNPVEIAEHAKDIDLNKGSFLRSGFDSQPLLADSSRNGLRDVRL